MTKRYVKTILFFFLLVAPVGLKAQIQLYPFEDYEQCKTGFITTNTNTWLNDTIFPAKFENVVELYADLGYLRNEKDAQYWIVSDNGKFGCLCNNGNWVLECIYDTLSYSFYQFIAKLNGKTGTILPNLEMGFPYEFDDIYTDYPVYNWYHDLMDYYNSTAEFFVRKNNLLGVYSFARQPIIAPQFDSIQSMVWNADYLRNTEIPEKRFYRVKKNNRVGLYLANGTSIFSPRYRNLEVFVDHQPTDYTQLFLVTDSLNRYAVINEFGKELVPFSKFKYEPLVTLHSVKEEQSPQYVIEQDQRQKKQRISSLITGKSSEWYTTMNFVEDYILVKSGKNFVVLDTNFQVVYQQTNAAEQLMYFTYDGSLDSAKNYPRTIDELYNYYRTNNETNAVTQMFVLEKTIGNQHHDTQPKKLYRWVNLSTQSTGQAGGLYSAGTYEKIVRLGGNGIYYYWCMNSIKDSTDKDIAFSADIYDDSGLRVRTVQLDRAEEATITGHGGFDFVSNQTHPFVSVLKVNGKNTLFGIDGWQPAVHEFEDEVICVKNGDSGYLCFTDKNHKKYFTDLTGKPLLGGKRFKMGGRYPRLGFQIVSLIDESGLTLFVNKKLDVLLDSCEFVHYDVEHSKIKYQENFYGYSDYRTFPIRKGYVYVVFTDSIKLVDSSLFDFPNGMNEIVREFYVDNAGKKKTSEEVRRYLKAEKKSNDYYTYWIENNQLKIEYKHTGLVRVIPNIYDYQIYYSQQPLKVITTDGKEGILNVYDGEWLLKPLYKHVYYAGGQKQLFFVQDKQFDENRWVIVDGNGKLLTKTIFDEYFNFGLNDTWSYAWSDSLLGIVNLELEWVTEPKYSRNVSWSNHYDMLEASDHHAIVDKNTGKSFRTTRDTLCESNSRYIFFFNDSIEIINREGVEVLSAIKISEAIATKDIYQFIYDDYYPYGEYNPPSNGAGGYAIHFTDSSTFLRQLSNQFLIDNARYEAASIKGQGRKYVYTDGNPNYDTKCSRYSLKVSENLYSERVEGKCFEQPEYITGMNQKNSYRTYWIKNDSLVPVQCLSDLFIDGSDYETRLDKLIEEQIQSRQIFGIACANIPAAVAEFKLNFYIDDYGLGFCSYEENNSKNISIDLNNLKDVLKPGVMR